MKELIIKILTLLLILIGLWIVATIGFAIFRIAMSLVVGLLTIVLIVGIGFLLYKFVQIISVQIIFLGENMDSVF